MSKRFLVGPIITESFRLWGKKFLTYNFIPALFLVPSFFFTLFVNDGFTFDDDSTPVFLSISWAKLYAGEFLLKISSFLAMAAVSYTAIQDLRGKYTELGEAFSKAFRLIFPLAILSLIFALLYGYDFGVWIYTAIDGAFAIVFWFFAPVLLFEDPKLIEGLRRSAKLSKGRRLEIFCLYLFCSFLAIGIGILLLLTTEPILKTPSSLAEETIGYLLFYLLYCLAIAFGSTLTAVSYRRLSPEEESASADPPAPTQD